LVKNTIETHGQIVFERGQFICKYNGEVITITELISRYQKETSPYSAMLHKHNNTQMYEDAALRRGIGSLINHSRTKDNCRLSIRRDSTIAVVATKRIENNSEIFLNYGNTYRFNRSHIKSETNHKK
jgi:SET domain